MIELFKKEEFEELPGFSFEGYLSDGTSLEGSIEMLEEFGDKVVE